MSGQLELKKPLHLQVPSCAANWPVVLLIYFLTTLLEENGLFFIETSALDSSHVEEAFTRILEGKGMNICYNVLLILYLYIRLCL